MRKFITDILAKANLGVEQNAYVLGTVGIGTSTPSTKLHVEGSGYSFIAGYDSGNRRVYIGLDSAGEPSIQGTLSNGTARQISINPSGGNVAIGTTTAAVEKLQVNGNIRLGVGGSNDQLAIMHGSGSSDYGAVRFYSAGTNTQTIHAFSAGWQGGNIFNASTNAINIDGGAGVTFGSWPTPDVVFVDGGVSYFKNNVGIGTTSPADKLQVQNGNLSLYSNSYGNTGLVRHFGTDSLEKYQQGLTTGGDFYQYTFSGLNHIFYTNNGFERMRITSGGNILMNTTNSPTAGGFTNTTLSVKQVADGLYGGGLHIEENATTSVAYFGFNGIAFNIGTSYRTTGDYRPIAFSTNGAERLRIANDGNVGIGVTNPAYKLHVENNLNGGLLQALRNTNTGTSQYVEFKLGTSDSSELRLGSSYNYAASEWNQTWIYAVNRNLALKTSAGFDIRFYAGGTDDSYERMRVTNGGNVGIGTTSPAYKLDVNGTGRFSGTLISNDHEIKNSANSETLDLFLSPSVFNAYIDYPTSRSLNFRNKSTGVSLTLASTGEATFSSSVSATIGSFSNYIVVGGTSGLNAYGTINQPTGEKIIFNSYHGLELRTSGGVGSGTPISVFNISSAGAATFSSSVTASSLIKSGGTSSQYLMADGSVSTLTNPVTGTGTTNYIPKWTSGSAIGNSQVFDNGTDVGIGTSSPISKLQVNGQFRQLYSRAFISNPLDSDGYAGHIIVNSNNANGDLAGIGLYTNSSYNAAAGLFALQESSTAASMVFYAGSNLATERMRITSGGNVGIGTTSPTTPLRVEGGGVMTGGWNKNTTLAATYPVLIFNSNATKWAGIGYDYSEGLRVWLNATSDDVNTVTPQFNILNNGNVGIGTTSPGFKLTVAGGSGDWATKFSSGTASAYFAHSGGYGASIDAGTSATSSTYILDLLSNGSTRMYVRGDGNVGIGTTSPSSILQLGAGSYTATNSSYNSFNAGGFGVLFRDAYDSYLTFNTVYGASGWVNKYSSYKSAVINLNDGALDISTGTGTTAGSASNLTSRLTMTNVGNVGIGTSSPSQKLHLYGSGNQLLFIENSSTYHLYTGIASNVGIVGSNNATPLSLQTNGVSRVYLDTSGNVGIGTTSPFNKLTVGSVPASGYGLITISADWASGSAISTGIKIGAAADTGGAGVDIRSHSNYAATSGTEMSFWTNSTPGNVLSERMRITSGGNVGIGTTSPSRLLHVLAATGIDAYARIEGGLGGYGGYLELMANSGGSSTDSAGRLDFYMSSSNRIATIDAQRTAAGANYGTLILSTANNATTPTERMRITSGGNVGIGTTSPANKLDVVGDGIRTSADQSTSAFLVLSGTSTEGRITVSSYGSYQPMTFYTGGSERMRINTSGNVGIGTTSPSKKLHIKGGDDDVLFLDNGGQQYTTQYFANNGTTKAFLAWDNTNSVYSIGTAVSAAFYFSTNNTERMRITSGGNVGIGTTSPGYKLDVVSSDSLIARFNGSAVVSNSATEIDILGPQSNGELNVGVGGSTLSNSTNNIQNKGFITAGSGLDGLNLRSDQGYVQITAGGITSANEVARFTAAGNVGIGTTSPGAMLDIYHATNGYASVGLQGYSTAAKWFLTSGISGDTIQDFSISHNNNGTSPVFRLSNSTGAATFSSSVTASSFGGNSYPYNSILGSGADASTGTIFAGSTSGYASSIDVAGGGAANPNTIIFKTASTEKMRITTGGNVGIGTSTGHYFTTNRTVLNINGTSSSILGLQAGNTTAGYLYSDANDFTISTEGTRNLNLVTAGNAPMVFQTNTTEKMRITSAGNVGIGTTSPTGKLHVILPAYTSEDTDSQQAIFGSGTNGNGVRIGYSESGNSGYVNALKPGVAWSQMNIGGANILFNTIGNERMRIDTSGNVGIGTTSPGAKLHVSAGYGLVNNGYSWAVYNSSSSGFAAQFGAADDVAFVNTGNNAIVAAMGSNAILFGTNSTERMRITSGGNVGIGNTSPQARLDLGSGYGANGEKFIIYNDNNSSALAGTKVGFYMDRFGLTNNSTFVFPTDTVGNPGSYIIASKDTSGTTLVARMAVLGQSGNVGIGTASPLNILHVSQPSAATVLRIGNNSNYDQSIYFNGGNDWSMGMDYSNSNAFVLSNYSSLGTNDRLVVTTGGNVGIGTTSPAYKLDVNGGSVGNNIARFTTGGGSGGTRGLYVYSNDSYVKLQVNDNAGNVGSWAFMSLNPEGGNVGIGITNPGHKLHVVGAVGIGQNTNGTATIDAYGGNAYYGCDGTQITVAGNTGNVGIGTASPGYKLEVAGTSYFSGLAHFGQTATSGSAFRWGAFGTAVSSDTMLCHNQLWNGSGWTIIDSSVGTGYMNLGGQLASPNIQFGTGAANTAASTKMIILNNGNVGIGTTSPGARLTVQTTTASSAHSLRITDGTGDITIGHWDTVTNRFEFSGKPTSFVQYGTGNYISFGTLGSENIRIAAGGNVGIGTTSPGLKLDVVGGNSLSGTAYATFRATQDQTNYRGVVLGYDTSGQIGIIYPESAGAASSLAFWTYTGSSWGERMRITSGGSVGIGTTSPSYNLHVEGNTSGISIYASHDIAAFSDITVKKEVKKIENAIEKVKELNGYTYVRTDDETGTRRAGVIAQEVQKVLPEVVSANPDGTLNVAYSNMIALLIEGMKEQQATIERLENRIKMLEK